jgi:hypothetical protein
MQGASSRGDDAAVLRPYGQVDARLSGGLLHHMGPALVITSNVHLNADLLPGVQKPNPRIALLPVRFGIANHDAQVSVPHGLVLLSRFFFSYSVHAKRKDKTAHPIKRAGLIGRGRAWGAAENSVSCFDHGFRVFETRANKRALKF